MVKNIREEQVKLDKAIKNLARLIVSNEQRFGSVQKMSVVVKSLEESKKSRLLNNGKALIPLLPTGVILGIFIGREMDRYEMLDDLTLKTNKVKYADLGPLIGLVSASSLAVKRSIDLKKKNHLAQTLIKVHYQYAVKEYFIYDLDPNEKPDNMDKIILKRVVDEVSRLKQEEN